MQGHKCVHGVAKIKLWQSEESEIPKPADNVSPALTIAAKGSVPSEKMPIPMNINTKKRPRIEDDMISAMTMSREDNPSSSL